MLLDLIIVIIFDEETVICCYSGNFLILEFGCAPNTFNKCDALFVKFFNSH